MPPQQSSPSKNEDGMLRPPKIVTLVRDDCKECGASYKWASGLSRHIRVAHRAGTYIRPGNSTGTTALSVANSTPGIKYYTPAAHFGVRGVKKETLFPSSSEAVANSIGSYQSLAIPGFTSVPALVGNSGGMDGLTAAEALMYQNAFMGLEAMNPKRGGVGVSLPAELSPKSEPCPVDDGDDDDATPVLNTNSNATSAPVAIQSEPDGVMDFNGASASSSNPGSDVGADDHQVDGLGDNESNQSEPSCSLDENDD